MSGRGTIAALVVLVVCLVGFSAPVEAQGPHHRNHIAGVRGDVHADLGWYGSFGIGGRVDIPIVPNGFLRNVDDELVISPGAELYFFNYYSCGPYDAYCTNHGVSFWPTVMAQWNFYLNDKWSVFPEAGLVGLFYDAYYCNGGPMCPNGMGYHTVFLIRPSFSVGARYHFGGRLALLMRFNWPAGFQIGLAF